MEAKVHRTIKSLREEFNVYYSALKADSKIEGYIVNKQDEWKRFLEHAREENLLVK